MTKAKTITMHRSMHLPRNIASSQQQQLVLRWQALATASINNTSLSDHYLHAKYRSQDALPVEVTAGSSVLYLARPLPVIAC
jgi:hypothetical protein